MLTRRDPLDMKSLLEALKDIHLAHKSAISLDKTEPDYVLDLDAQKSDLSGTPLIAATSSSNNIRLFNRESLALSGLLTGHSEAVTGVRFSHQDKDILFTSSQDHTVRCWDLRTPKSAVTTYKGYDRSYSIFTCLDLSPDDRLLCAGSEVDQEGDAYITFWDKRSCEKLGCYSESHQDDITQVLFHPTQTDVLASASTDGLICVYDITQASEDDALLSTLNSCSSVQKIGWCGKDSKNIYCITHIDTFHIWQAFEGDSIFNLLDIKEKAKGSWDVDYIVDCVRTEDDTNSSKPILLTGNHSGSLELLEIDDSGEEVKLSCVNRLTDGHTATVRCMLWDDHSETLLTGAEDSLLCMWSANGTSLKTTLPKTSKVRGKLKTGKTSKSKKQRPY